LELIDLSLIDLIKQDNVQAFEKVFTDWFGRLHGYAFSVLNDESVAEEVVQSVFCRIWERRNQLNIHTSLKAYLYGSVYHGCLSWIREEKSRMKHRTYLLHTAERITVGNAASKAELGELEKKLQQTIDELPDQCRAIFQLSRFGELKYREIAEQLGISVKTVEAQMSKALKQLRGKLVDFIE
jgi:RNA polymerase sigma-70 factor (ECF subfamily)